MLTYKSNIILIYVSVEILSWFWT